MVEQMSRPPAAAGAGGWAGLAAAYFMYFGFLGTLQPYLALLYLEHGLSPATVGPSVALLYLLAGGAPLVASALAAGAGMGVRSVFAIAAGVALAVAGLLATSGSSLSHASYVGAIALLTAAYAPLNVLLDTTAVQACNAHGWSFGRLRLMGSLGYIATATGMGRLLPASQVSSSVHMAIATLAAAVFVCTPWIPDAPMRSDAATRAANKAGSTALAPSPLVFTCLLAALGLHYASFGPFQYGFTLYGRSVGLTPMAIGLGWSLGVLSEVVAFLFAGTLLQRFGWRRVLMLAFVLAPLRWIALAAVPHPTTFFVSQLLHGPSFALFTAAAMAGLSEVGPADRQKRGQTIFSALLAGLASGPAMLFAGYAFAYISLAAMFACMLPANLLSFVLLMVVVRRAKEFVPVPAPIAPTAKHA